MKTISIIFQKMNDKTPQVEWVIKELVNPYVHQIVLIFLIPEKMYVINEPNALLLYNKISENELYKLKNKIKIFLDGICKRFKEEFGESIEVMKLVICGDEKYKLDACLSSLGTKMVVLGPDTMNCGIKSFFLESLDDFITAKVGIPVMKVPKKYV